MAGTDQASGDQEDRHPPVADDERTAGTDTSEEIARQHEAQANQVRDEPVQSSHHDDRQHDPAPDEDEPDDERPDGEGR